MKGHRAGAGGDGGPHGRGGAGHLCRRGRRRFDRRLRRARQRHVREPRRGGARRPHDAAVAARRHATRWISPATLLSNLDGLARRASSAAPRWTASATRAAWRARGSTRGSCTSTRSGSRATSERSSRAARSASRVRTANDSLVVTMTVDSLGGLRRYLGVSPATAGDSAAALDSLMGTLRSRLVVRGWLDSLDVQRHARRAATCWRARNARAACAARSPCSSSKGRATGTVVAASRHRHGGRDPHRSGHARRADARQGARALLGDGHGAGTERRCARAESTRSSPTARTCDSTRSTSRIGKSRWGLLLPMRVRSTPIGAHRGHAAARRGRRRGSPARRTSRRTLRCAGICAPTGCRWPTSACSRSSRRRSPDGSASTSTSPARAPSPRSSLTGAADSLKVGGLSAEAMRVSGRYALDRAAMDATLVRGGRSILDASIDYPVSRHALHGQAHRRLAARTHPRRQRGPGAGRGALAQAEERHGPARARSGGERRAEAPARRRDRHDPRRRTIEIPSFGLRFANIDMQLNVDPRSDSLAIEQLRWTSPASGGIASVVGSVVFRELKNPRIDLRLDARGAARGRQERARAARRLHRRDRADAQRHRGRRATQRRADRRPRHDLHPRAGQQAPRGLHAGGVRRAVRHDRRAQPLADAAAARRGSWRISAWTACR